MAMVEGVVREAGFVRVVLVFEFELCAGFLFIVEDVAIVEIDDNDL